MKPTIITPIPKNESERLAALYHYKLLDTDELLDTGVEPAFRDCGKIASGQILRVLVVEDNAVNQRLVQLMLEKQGCRVDLAANGHQALHLLEQGSYDLILIDCRMPEMDGYEATRRIRAREQGKRRTPIIALTASAMEGDREKCLAAGMDAFLAKPILQPDLAQIVERYLPRAKLPLGPEAHVPAEESAFTLSALTARIGNDPEMLHEFAVLFMDETSRLLASCQEAAQHHDCQALILNVHALKGILMTLEAGREIGQIIELARMLQQCAQTGDTPDALSLIAILETRLTHIANHLRCCLLPTQQQE